MTYSSKLSQFFDNSTATRSNFYPKTVNQLPAIVNNNFGDTGLHLGAGINAPFLDIATPAVFSPAVIVVTSVPNMYIGQPMGYLIKNLIESHAKSISNIDVEYTLNVESNANVGHDGQTMTVPTKTNRQPQSPSITMQELSGNIVYETFRQWIWDINHPDTYVSNAGGIAGTWTMSAYAMSMMVIQFDPTMRPDRILGAAHLSNMFPVSPGSFGFERNIGTSRAPERSISFSQCIVQENKYITRIAKNMAEKLNLHLNNYDAASPYRDVVDSEIDSLGQQQESLHRQTYWHQID